MTDCGCEKAKQELEEYLHNELRGEDAADIREHMQNCADCAGEHKVGVVLTEAVKRGFEADLSLPDAARLAVRSLGADGGPNAEPRKLGVEALEVAILDRNRSLPRKFRRIAGERLAALLDDQVEPTDQGHEAPQAAAPEAPVTETELAAPAPAADDTSS